jgi:hypothetical protein
VIIEQREPVVVAVVFKPRGRSIVAERVWALVEDGIVMECRCEKGLNCAADGLVHWPANADQIELQLATEIQRLRAEYAIAPRHLSYVVATGHGGVRHVPGLKLGGRWLDEATLSAARALFDARYRRTTRGRGPGR